MSKLALWTRLIREVALTLLVIVKIAAVVIEIVDKTVNCNARKLHRPVPEAR